MKNTLHKILGLGLFLATSGITLQAQMVVVNVNINQPATLVADAGNTTVGITVCEGDTAVLGGNPTAIGGTAPYLYAWSPGTSLNSSTVANPMANPSSNITYNVQVQDANNCSSTSSVSVTVVSAPVAAFSSTPTVGFGVDFFDLSTGTVTNWLWDFGDGVTSTQQNPTHTYAAAGQYTVCLTATNNGCDDQSCTTLSVIVGVDAPLALRGLQVYPNPYRGETQLVLEMTESEVVKLEAFDAQGKLVGLVHEGALATGPQALRFSAAAFGAPAGVYLLRLTVGAQQATVRVHELH